MIEIPEFKRILSIMGFTKVDVLSPKNLLYKLRKNIGAIPLQILDATFIAGELHILFAVLNALNAFKHEKNLSEHLEIEMLLYISGQRQISKAIKLIGVKTNTQHLAIIFLTTNHDEATRIEHIIQQLISGQRDDSIINLTPEKRAHLIQVFDITPTQLQSTSKLNLKALEALVIEKSAMLAIS